VTLTRTQSAGFWLDTDLLSLTSCTVDDVAQTVADIELYPSHYGPPYSWIGVTGADIDVVGVFGYSDDTAAAGTIVEDLTAAETAVDVSDSSLIGIGDLILVNAERMLVTAKSQLDSGQNLSGDLVANTNDVTVGLTLGTAFAVGEIILVDSERMLIVDISGNNGTVKRAYDGSVLAAHSATADIYVPRTLTVERAAAGTTATTHTNADTITRNLPPSLITDLTLAEALTTYEQESAGYARVVGSGESQREARGAGLVDLRSQARGYRRLRVKAV
jgi:hypothetical protein